MPNHHLSQTVRIGEINAEGGFTILEETGVVLPQAWNQKHPSSKDLHAIGQILQRRKV